MSKELSEREKRIEALRKEHRITRAHAVSIINMEEAAKNRKLPTPEEIKTEADRFLAPESVPQEKDGQ